MANYSEHNPHTLTVLEAQDYASDILEAFLLDIHMHAHDVKQEDIFAAVRFVKEALHQDPDLNTESIDLITGFFTKKLNSYLEQQED